MNAAQTLVKTIAPPWLLFCFASFTACGARRAEPPDKVGFGPIVGANYTKNAIQSFTVDGAWGGNVHPYSGGGSYLCCARYPGQWTPAFNVLVQWRRSDRRAADGVWQITSIETRVSVEKYINEGNVYVLFLPRANVKVFISEVGVGSPHFPTNPGYPEAAKRGAP